MAKPMDAKLTLVSHEAGVARFDVEVLSKKGNFNPNNLWIVVWSYDSEGVCRSSVSEGAMQDHPELDVPHETSSGGRLHHDAYCWLFPSMGNQQNPPESYDNVSEIVKF